MIIVASHVNFRQAWDTLRESFVQHGQNMREVIVVIAGSAKESIHADDPNNEVYIEVPYNFYEFTALYGASAFLDHPRMKDLHYLIVHDTSMVIDGFAEGYADCAKLMSQNGLDALFLTPTKQLMQVMVSYDFLKAHGHTFGINGDKPKAWQYEHGADGSIHALVAPEKQMAIGDPILYGPATKYPSSDIWRHPIFISPIKLYKYVANDDRNINPGWEHRDHP